MTTEGFIATWAASEAAERANKDAFLIGLCDVLGVPRPDPKTSDPERDRYVFEAGVPIVHEGAKFSTGSMDLYKRDAFILEAKQGSSSATARVGSARRKTAGWTVMMQAAFGQALGYARTLDKPPPFLIVADIGWCFDLYASFDGSRNYFPFPDAQHNRLYFSDLAQHLDVLRAVWTDPRSLDPSRRTAKVTRDVAAHLAELAKAFEAKHDPELVARFLMRCIFTMFAEDVGLLPDRLFTDKLRTDWIEHPERFQREVESLWRVMNTGGEQAFLGKILRFNGGLFADATALPITDRATLKLLLEAAECDWRDVEPAIFGTLLERALDPKERHRLGAHYTPRAYVERLVRPTIEEPLREQWDAVRASVLRAVGEATLMTETPSPTKKKRKAATTADARADVVRKARAEVQAFEKTLCETRVLDPACGSGNFLYVALDVLKRLESEVVALDTELARSIGAPTSLAFEWGSMVTPAQFLGIEKKRWAKEIAELVLWVGFLQWYARTRRTPEGKVQWPEPVLRDLHNVECRDAVLAWDREEPVLDAKGKPVTRWDGESTKASAVTGELVPDETKRVLVTKLVNPRRPEWPEAEYIVGNPPFLGKLRLMGTFGEGYTTALRAIYDGLVPDSADFVMYWWFRAAELARLGKIRRFGFITTNSITQTFNRRVLEAAQAGEAPLSIAFAIPDHPWVDSADGASVRIAMTVGVVGGSRGTLLEVADERVDADGAAQVSLATRGGLILPDLRIGAAVTSAQPLRANSALASMGPMFGSRGFVLSRVERDALVAADGPRAADVVRPFYGGRDLTDRAREQFVIDLHGNDAAQARARFPAIYQHLLDTVFPSRAQNNDPKLRDAWWLFRRSNETYRAMVLGLSRFFVTTETSKHRVFTQASSEFIAEHGTISFGTDDAFVLGVLSSRAHVTWALAAGGRLGVGNDPRYNKTRCFDPYPFPDATDAQRSRIRDLAEQLDAHRKRRQAAHPTLTMTGMYNVLAKLRSGETLTDKDRVIHDAGLVSVLRQLHDDLDAAVFEAYGWPSTLTDEEILAKVVALNAERTEEERRGLVRWLRPEFQNPTGTRAETQTDMDLGDDAAVDAAPPTEGAVAWPRKPAEQFVAVREWLRARPAAVPESSVGAAFKWTDAEAVTEALDGLVSLGLAVRFEAEGGSWVRGA